MFSLQNILEEQDGGPLMAALTVGTHAPISSSEQWTAKRFVLATN